MKLISCAGVLSAAILLAGCGTHASPSATTPQPNNSASQTAANNTSTGNTSATGSANSTTSENLSSSNTAGQSGQANSTGGTQTNGSTTTNAQLIQQSMRFASYGEVVNVPYAADTSLIDQIEQQWGQPNTQNSAGAGIYATFSSRHIAFGFNKGSQVFDVRSFSPQMQQITLSEVTHVLGAADATRHYSNQTILLYTAGPKFQLLWVFPNPTASTPDPKLEHVSVFCPQDTVDLMAQNVADPGIVIDQQPGSVGTLFTFHFQTPPESAGYQLSELEWIGKNGQTVVNTDQQAIRHGQSGGPVPSFQISGDGSTIGFNYPTSMAGQSGKVVAIFQAVSGQAVVTTSSQIKLK